MYVWRQMAKLFFSQVQFRHAITLCLVILILHRLTVCLLTTMPLKNLIAQILIASRHPLSHQIHFQYSLSMKMLVTALKVFKYGVFSGLFSPNTGKYGPEKIPYLDTST